MQTEVSGNTDPREMCAVRRQLVLLVGVQHEHGGGLQAVLRASPPGARLARPRAALLQGAP